MLRRTRIGIDTDQIDNFRAALLTQTTAPEVVQGATITELVAASLDIATRTTKAQSPVSVRVAEKDERHLYPVTIIATRYGGTYEGAAWAAFNLDECDVPVWATASDLECSAWWRDVAPGFPVAVGPSPDASVEALRRKVAND